MKKFNPLENYRPFKIPKMEMPDMSKINEDFIKSQSERFRLEEESRKAMIKMSEKNWFERHPFWFGFIMLIIGAILTEIVRIIFQIYSPI